MKALVFTVSGNYARFRCPYTTTSALTYTVFHPIAIKGLIGAIMGIRYEDLYEYTKNMKVAIEVLSSIKKDIQSFNLVPQVKNNGSPNFQSRVEFLRKVMYRIFISDNEDKLVDIERVMRARNYVFTPYLGASEHIAKIEFENLAKVEKVIEEKVIVNSVVPKEYVIFDELGDIEICLDRIPIKNQKNREYIEYEKIAFVPSGGILVKGVDINKVGDNNVYFF